MRRCIASNFFLIVTFLLSTADGLKLKFASENDCDRQSLDALYYEKYEPMTSESLSDISGFISRITDLVSKSLLSVMAELPGSESSSAEERKIFETYKELNKKFQRSINRIKKNVTSAWESLLSANHDLMLDKANSSLDDVWKKVMNISDVYNHSRSILERDMEMVLTIVKNVVRSGMKGISIAVETEMEKEAQNVTKERSENDTPKPEEKDAVSKETILRKRKEMVEMLVPQFLKKVSMVIIQKGIYLEKSVGVESEDRDSVLDDVYFSLLLMRNRVTVITQRSYPRNKENIDLARRNLYLFWGEQANAMYKDKIKEQGTAPTGEKSRKLWANEDKLAEALVSLMEQYP